MTPRQCDIVQALLKCTFLPGSFDKRFVKSIASRPAVADLTPKQADYLVKIAWKYRRQLPADIAYPADEEPRHAR